MEQDIEEWEIEKVVEKLKMNQANYYDNITNKMIKYGYRGMKEGMRQLFKWIYNAAIFPLEWSKAYIAPIHKKEGRTNPSNYRWIAVSSCLGKVFSGVVNKSFENEDDEERGTTYQNGFDRDRRTVDNLFVITTYDSVDRELLYKLLHVYNQRRHSD